MNAWKADQHADDVMFLPDGNCEFSRAMGMLVEKDDLGFGPRSWRYSMLVRDGVIEKMFIEPEQEGDPYEVSDADTMLAYLDPEGERPPDIVMFTKPGCSHCSRARRMLEERAVPFEEIAAGPRRLRAVSGRQTTPQVFVDGKHIGGADELERYLNG
jgi:glutaredoxin